jgi:hypothetical protein
MTWFKHISTLMLCISIAFAGVPAQAQPCSMMKMMQAQHAKQMDMKGMKDCDQMTKQAPKKSGGCCNDSGCNAQCSAMSGGVTMNLPTVKADMPAIGEQALRLSSADATIASAHLNSQERPPKSLA